MQNPHDPDAHYADKGTKQWIGYKVHVMESVDPEEPAKLKAEPGEHFITEILTTEAAQDEMAGLAESLKRQQEHHEMKPEAVYADAGYITENTLSQRRHGEVGLEELRRFLQVRELSTASHAVRRAEARLEKEPGTRRLLEQVLKRLNYHIQA